MDEARTIAVVGAGRVGTTLGARWAEVGHTVRYGVRDPGAARHAVLRRHASVVDVPGAVLDVDVVLLAVPGAVVVEVARSLPDLGATVVVDASNPLGADLRTHDRVDASGAEQVAAALSGGRVVKAFNTTGSGNMADPSGYDPAPAMWLAGDDADACAVVAGLAADLGFDPVVVGPLAAAADLEHLAVVWIRLAYTLGHGPDVAITLQRRR